MSTEDEHVEEFIREITRNQSAMNAYIKSLLPTHPDSRDILQEVNITLWKKRELYRHGSNFKAWAFKITRFHVLNEHRRMKKANQMVFDDDILDSLSEGLEITPALLDQRYRALANCKKKLRTRDRELLRVRYTQGTSIAQYSKLRGLKPGSVRAKLRDIRTKLKKCITQQMKKKKPNE